MGEKEKITEAEHLLVEISLDAKDGILNALKNISPAYKHSKTITTKNVHGIKDLSFSQTHITDTKGNSNIVKGYDYICDLDDDYELKISCKLALTSILNSKGKVPLKLTIPVMITHKRQKWSIGYELCLTLNPLEFFKNGLYIVLSVPFFGTQIVIKYNIITKNVTILFRLPLKDGNDEDKKGAAEAGCDLICLNILFYTKNISTSIYEYSTIKHFATNNQHIYNKLCRENSPTKIEERSTVANVRERIGNLVDNAADSVISAGRSITNFFGNLFNRRGRNSNYLVT